MRLAIAALVTSLAALPLLPARQVAARVAPTAFSVPKATCQPGDKVETALQGQVPLTDRANGRAAQGYNCNLKQVGSFSSNGWANQDSYKNCDYYGDSTGGLSTVGDTGTIVLDVSDPTHPVKTDYLTARAMGNPGESLRVNAKRGLLVANHYDMIVPGTVLGAVGVTAERTPWLAVYDVSQDCRHPKLLADWAMPTGAGHEGCFAPDGNTYYSYGGTTSVGHPLITPIDLTDPSHPRELGGSFPAQHGCNVSEDGTRIYFANNTELLVGDNTDFLYRRSNPQLRLVSRVNLGEATVDQSNYRLDYDGHPYDIDFGELSKNSLGGRTCDGSSNFDYPRMIDLADEFHPKVVSLLKLEVDDPANCNAVRFDSTLEHPGPASGHNDGFWALISGLFIYDDHHCSPDRLHNPTILACAQFLAGIRVYDIRDPLHPREFAYYNPGTLSPTDPTVEMTASRPVVRRDLGQIWWNSVNQGFHVVQFENGVWPFKDSAPCPLGYDYYQAQYDLTYDQCLAAASTSTPSVPATNGPLPNTRAAEPVPLAAPAVVLTVLSVSFFGARWRRWRARRARCRHATVT